MTDHKWPTEPTEHVWDRWWNETGPPHAMQYRTCVHPNCKAIEHREVDPS